MIVALRDILRVTDTRPGLAMMGVSASVCPAHRCGVACGVPKQDCRAVVGPQPDGDPATPGVLIVVHLLALLNVRMHLLPAAGNAPTGFLDKKQCHRVKSLPGLGSYKTWPNMRFTSCYIV